MATVDFTVTTYGKRAGTVRASTVKASGQDIITTVENIEGAGGDITVAPGDVFAIHASAAMRIAFGGAAATGTTGHYIPASTLVEIEIAAGEGGNVSAIEAA